MTDEGHVFEANDGTEYTFDTQEEMMDFAIRYSFQGLVAEGYGSIVTIDGEDAFKINEQGLQHLKDCDTPSSH